MKGPIYQRFHFEDGSNHGLLRRDVLAREQEQLLALAKATGNYEPLQRWLDRRATEGYSLLAADQEKREHMQAVKARAEKARAAKDKQTRLKYERIREIAGENCDLTGEELVWKVRVVWGDRYGQKTMPKERAIYRALGLLP